MELHILGIRHHGTGSARRTKTMLEQLSPDLILIEGPPDAEGIVKWVTQADMQPPVAILAYQPDNLKNAVYYPFAEFSPEWQALVYGQSKQIPIRFMDLPLCHKFPLLEQQEQQAASQTQTADTPTEPEELPIPPKPVYPLDYLAQAAGYPDYELWWEHWFEQRQEDAEAFEAVMEAMKALRQTLPETPNHIEQLREAYMRKTIRQAQKEGYKKIAVVCGAWHAPALADMPPKKQDDELLKNLPKTKIETTWIPWTYSRLSFESGYGAGINSPGWYEHLWLHPNDVGELWLTKVAKLFRNKQIDVSVAHVIEAVRLAQMLAAIRAVSSPGLAELNEATQTVMCFGEPTLMQLIERELIVSNKLGTIPTGTPKVPLQADLEANQKTLKLPASPDPKIYELDLRKENDLQRSKFLNRLTLLGINWGEKQRISGRGTYWEKWEIQWKPEMLVKTIEMGIWGNTVLEATCQYLLHLAENTQQIIQIAELIEKTIPADLEQITDNLIERLNQLAALSNDTIELMKTVTPLAQVTRYGNVRKTNMETLQVLVSGMLSRIFIGLPPACYSLDDEAANEMLGHLQATNDAVNLLQNTQQITDWHKTLMLLAQNEHINPLVEGYTTRLLFDAKELPPTQTEVLFSKALTNKPEFAAAWLEGFLKGSGTILLLDDNLWHVLYAWVATLEGKTFVELLPLLRRTFANFSSVERQKIGEKVKGQGLKKNTTQTKDTLNFDMPTAEKSLGLLKELLSLE